LTFFADRGRRVSWWLAGCVVQGGQVARAQRRWCSRCCTLHIQKRASSGLGKRKNCSVPLALALTQHPHPHLSDPHPPHACPQSWKSGFLGLPMHGPTSGQGSSAIGAVGRLVGELTTSSSSTSLLFALMWSHQSSNCACGTRRASASALDSVVVGGIG
jgi:hypothetical protein